jgi:hypothetical protein
MDVKRGERLITKGFGAQVDDIDISEKTMPHSGSSDIWSRTP